MKKIFLLFALIGIMAKSQIKIEKGYFGAKFFTYEGLRWRVFSTEKSDTLIKVVAYKHYAKRKRTTRFFLIDSSGNLISVKEI